MRDRTRCDHTSDTADVLHANLFPSEVVALVRVSAVLLRPQRRARFPPTTLRATTSVNINSGRVSTRRSARQRPSTSTQDGSPRDAPRDNVRQHQLRTGLHHATLRATTFVNINSGRVSTTCTSASGSARRARGVPVIVTSSVIRQRRFGSSSPPFNFSHCAAIVHSPYGLHLESALHASPAFASQVGRHSLHSADTPDAVLEQ